MGSQDSRPMVEISPMPALEARAEENLAIGSTMSTVVAMERRRPSVMRPILVSMSETHIHATTRI